MIKLSAVIITLNEEQNIQRCLNSLIEVADEIVIVDSFSTDRTKAIATTFEVTFIEHPFEDYLKQKQYAVSQASYDHILALDADEYLSTTLKASILTVKKQWTFDGYFCNRKNFFCGQWIRFSDWYPNKKLRVFDRTKADWTGHIVHEKVTLNDPRAPIGFLKGDLLHHTYQSYSEFHEQTKRFSSLSAQAYFEQGKKAPLLKLALAPLWAFIKTYMLRLGLLDGYNGLVISYETAVITYLKYAKLRRLTKTL